MRFYLALLFGVVLASCSSNPKNDYSDRPDPEDFYSAEERLRLEGVRVDQAAPNRVAVFAFDEDEHLSFICDQGDCAQFKQNDGFTISLNYDGSFSSFPRVIKPGTLQICGTGDAFKYFDHNRIWGNVGLRRSRAYMGNRDWSSEDPGFCHHLFTKPKVYQDAGLMLMNLISSSLASYGVHVREPDPDALKKAVIGSKLDMLVKQLYTNGPRKSFGDYRVIEYQTDSLQQALRKQLDMPVSRDGRHDGVVFFNNGSNPIATPLSFKASSRNDQMSDLLNDLSGSLGKSASAGKENSNFISRFIPPKVRKPVIPSIPKLQKGEFEKQRNFELRAKKVVTEKENEVHRLVQNYNFEVFSRNEYVKAVTKAYQDHLNKQSSLATRDRQAFIEHLDLVSGVIFQSLYSDLTVTSFDYDSEAENLYMSLVSPRNNLKERAVVSLEPEIAKKIKLENDYRLSLDVTIEDNSLSLSGVHVHHDDERYTASFTQSQFKPMRLIMELAEPINIDMTDQQADASVWLQKDTDLRGNINHANFYLTLRKNYNFNLPEWFTTPCADCVTFKGNSIDEALSSARAELSRRKHVRVAASQTVNNEMFESTSGLSSYSGSYAETVKTESNSVLTRDEYTVTKQEEIDGNWYVELKFL